MVVHAVPGHGGAVMAARSSNTRRPPASDAMTARGRKAAAVAADEVDDGTPTLTLPRYHGLCGLPGN